MKGMELREDHRAGYVAIVGKPNVGKSTLVNHLLGRKLSAVTSKPQTTRHRILSILTGKAYQVIFLDTPGLFRPKYRLQELMVNKAYSTFSESDLILVMVEPYEFELEEEPRERLKRAGRPTVLAINKIDLVKKGSILPLIDAYSKAFDFRKIVPVSALTGDGLDILLQEIIELLPRNEPFYPEQTLTIHPERFFVEEIIREKVFDLYGEEIPYSVSVRVDEFKERKGRKDYIRAILYVERESQKAILIGKRGEALKRVGERSRSDIEIFLGRPVYLELWVKIRKEWRKKESALRDLGY